MHSRRMAHPHRLVSLDLGRVSRLSTLLILGLVAAGCGRSAPGPAAGGAAPAQAEPGAPATASPSPAGAAPSPAGAASPVPEAPMKFVDLDGLRKELEARRRAGRPVFVNFWATWCAPCVDELPRLADLSREIGDKGPEIIGVSLDALTVPEKDRVEPKIRDMLSRSQVSYANLVLMDSQQAFMKAFDVEGGIPLSILYDGGGKSVKRWTGSVEMDDVRRAFRGLPPG